MHNPIIGVTTMKLAEAAALGRQARGATSRRGYIFQKIEL